MNKRCLFIGGIADGEIREIDVDMTECRVTVPHAGYPHVAASYFTEQSYRRECFSEDKKMHYVYVHAVEPGKILQAIIDGYAARTVALKGYVMALRSGNTTLLEHAEKVAHKFLGAA